VVRPETAETVLHGLADVGGLGALALLVHLHAELGGEHHPIAPASQRQAEEFLAAAPVVNVRGVQEVHTAVESGIHYRRCRLRIDAPPEVITSQPDHGDFQRSDPSLLHYIAP
jgi:hypothetical protein